MEEKYYKRQIELKVFLSQKYTKPNQKDFYLFQAGLKIYA